MISFAEHPGGGPQQDPAPSVKPKAAAKIDSANHFDVVKTQTGVAMISPPLARQVLSRGQVVNLAAWLMAISGAEIDDVIAVMKEIAKK